MRSGANALCDEQGNQQGLMQKKGGPEWVRLEVCKAKDY